MNNLWFRLFTIISSCLLCFIVHAQERHVTKCEYWIDNHEMQEIPTNGEEVSFIVDASMESEGMHTLYFRIQDNAGMYSPLQTWVFMRSAIQDTITNCVALVEYWLDDNSNAIQSFIGESDTIGFSFDAIMLRHGLHTLNYRVKDLYGNYSATHTWAFFKREPQASKISWYKYWWNNNEDKAIRVDVDSEEKTFSLEQAFIIPDYAKTDGYSANSIARFHIVFGDNVGNISNIEWTDVTYPDVVPPISSIEADKGQATESVTLKWTSNEDYIEDYNLYYSENGQPFVLWLPNTTKETATFKGQPGATYRFTVTARDKAGNREQYNESKNVEVEFKAN